jgi:hypothetical protein
MIGEWALWRTRAAIVNPAKRHGPIADTLHLLPLEQAYWSAIANPSRCDMRTYTTCHPDRRGPGRKKLRAATAPHDHDDRT